MRRFLKHLFSRQDSESAPPEPQRSPERVRARLQETEPGSPEAARLLNQLADMELARGDRSAALRNYGQAIDTYMELRQLDAAMAICRKLIRLLPDVIRARCTLAWLSIGKGLLDPARQYVQEYVEAAAQAGREELAAQQLRLMARCVGDSRFREELAQGLRSLGDEERAVQIENAEVVGAGSSEEPVEWDLYILGALLTPEELEAAKERGLELNSLEVTEGDDLPLYGPSEGWR